MIDQPMTGVTLGRHQDYVDHYDASLLQPISRAQGREVLAHLAPAGVDLWTAYELSWLEPGGKPCVAVAEFTLPADSTSIVESKSFKYYLNSFNQTAFGSFDDVRQTLVRDLSAAAGGEVGVQLYTLDEFAAIRAKAQPLGCCLDELPLVVERYQPAVELLKVGAQKGSGVYYSHLLKTNCPVTGQPDWASIWIGYEGAAIGPESLLAYIVSFRQHQDFHEHCVERIYSELWQVYQPEALWVYARYTRRGGLDINPFRASESRALPVVVAARQ